MVKQERLVAMGRVLAVAAVAAVLLGATVAAGPALAGKPSGNGGNGGSSATLAVTPDPAPLYGFVHAEGCGYVVGKAVNIYVQNGGGGTRFFAVGVYDNSCISFDFYVGSAGDHTISAYQNLKGKQQTLMASDTFTVQ